MYEPALLARNKMSPAMSSIVPYLSSGTSDGSASVGRRSLTISAIFKTDQYPVLDNVNELTGWKDSWGDNVASNLMPTQHIRKHFPQLIDCDFA